MFNQPPPELGNQYQDDRLLRSYLRRTVTAEVLKEIEPSLSEMGSLGGGELYQLQLADRLNEPRLTQWDPWGERIDHIAVSPLWRKAEELAANHGLVAAAYDTDYGRSARIYQFALVYLFHPSTDVYTCPLAMTDGAARTLIASGNNKLIQRAVPHLISRDPELFWTSGQWMTESTGGSDVGRCETTAIQDRQGVWRLTGRKWFTSAVTSQMALALARPAGNPEGGRGLALFYLETRDASGRLCNIQVSRLKDKLGTRKVPTAELMLHGTPAEPVRGTDNGVRHVAPMLTVTRAWNCVSSVAFMRRGLALARDYARKRVAFGAPLAEQPLHADTLASLQAEMEGAFHLTFCLVELIGRDEARDIDEQQRRLLRAVSSIAKLTTARQAVAVASEVLECFGGAGYVEDTGLPMLLRDSQVLPIWEGTTNVLSLDTLRVLQEPEGLAALERKLRDSLEGSRDTELRQAGRCALSAFEKAQSWLHRAQARHETELQAGARRFALTLGRALELALLVEHAQWSLDNERDGRARVAAVRFAQSGVDQIYAEHACDYRSLGNDIPLGLGTPSNPKVSTGDQYAGKDSPV